MERCPGSEVLADSPVCTGCEQVIDRFRDTITGRDTLWRFVEHVRQAAAPPAGLVRAILDTTERPDLEQILASVAADLQVVASWLGDLTDPDELLAIQLRLATVSLVSESLEDDASRLRRSAA